MALQHIRSNNFPVAMLNHNSPRCCLTITLTKHRWICCYFKAAILNQWGWWASGHRSFSRRGMIFKSYFSHEIKIKIISMASLKDRDTHWVILCFIVHLEGRKKFKALSYEGLRTFIRNVRLTKEEFFIFSFQFLLCWSWLLETSKHLLR